MLMKKKKKKKKKKVVRCSSFEVALLF